MSETHFKTPISLTSALVSRSGILILPLRYAGVSLFPNLSRLRKIKYFGIGVISVILGVWKLRFITEKTCVIFHFWSSGYHHFVCEVLPKIVLYRNYLTNCRILIEANSPEFIYTSLKRLAPELSYTVIEGPVFLREVLLFPNPPSGVFKPGDLLALRSSLFRAFPQFDRSAVKPENRIIIVRKGSRQISNELDLLRILNKYNFKAIQLEDLSFDDQLDKFSKCNVLMGAHGAGLTNMLFMGKGATVIELMPIPTKKDRHPVNHCYCRMSKALGLNYVQIDSVKTSPNKQYAESEIMVDLEQVSQLMSSFA